MLTKIDIERLALMRLDEATALCDAGLLSGGYYLGGYAAELALKACIAKSFQAEAIPDRRFVDKVHTHDLKQLVSLAGLEASRKAREADDAVFAANWEYVSKWSESSRYLLVDENVVRSFMDALRNPDHGVFQWIRAH